MKNEEMRSRFAGSVDAALDERERRIRKNNEHYDRRLQQVEAFIAEAEQSLALAVEVLNDRPPVERCPEPVSLTIEIEERPFHDVTAMVRVTTPTPAASPDDPPWSKPQPKISWHLYLSVSLRRRPEVVMKLGGTVNGWHYSWEGLKVQTPECDPSGLNIERADSGALAAERFVAWFTRCVL